MKVLVGAFNQEKASVGAFSVIVQLHPLIVNGSRKEIRAEQEKKLAQQKREEEIRRGQEEADKKAREAEEKRKRLEAAEIKRQQMMQAQKEKQNAGGAASEGGGGNKFVGGVSAHCSGSAHVLMFLVLMSERFLCARVRL